MRVTIRWIPFVARYFCVAAVALAFITLFAGTSSSSESAAIITFNTSTLGLAGLKAPNSTLHIAILSLLPTPPPQNTTSITQYLGIKDWYALYYLSTCSGFFTPSTSYKTNIVCTRHISGYTFSLQDTLRSELYPTVKEVANEVSQAKYYTAPWIQYVK